MNQQSFAGNGLEDCSFHVFFDGFPLQLSSSPPVNPMVADCPDGIFNTAPIVVEYKPELLSGVTSNTVEADQAVHLELPNFFDEFNTKSIKVEIVYDALDNTPVLDNIRPFGQNFDTCFQDFFITTVDPNDIATLVEFWTCHPNPDNERVWITLDGADVRSVNVWTVSFDSQAVGGEIIPLDTTMVLVAGSQNTAAWMIPVIVSGIGIAIVIARKF